MALLLFGLLLLLAACGDKQETVAPTGDAAGSGNDGGDDPQAQGGGESGAGGTLWGVTNTLSLVGVDLATGEELLPPSLDQIVEPLTPLQSITVSDERVWLVTGDESSVTGGDGGRVLVLDATTGEEVDTLEFGGGVSALAADGGKVYIAHSEAGGEGLVVERLDAATLASEARARVLEDNPSHTVEALVPDGDTLWVLQGNGFALHNVFAASLEVQETVRLGRFVGANRDSVFLATGSPAAGITRSGGRSCGRRAWARSGRCGRRRARGRRGSRSRRRSRPCRGRGGGRADGGCRAR
jgi:hypothetical protein